MTLDTNSRIVELSRTSKEVSRFLRVPFWLYREEPNWVAPILSDLKKVFLDCNPFFQHAKMKMWVVEQNGRDVGRIAGIIDHEHNRCHKEKTAFFGFFESTNDPAVAAPMFQAVREWAAQEGMTQLLGPMNPSVNDECGLLIEGFDSPPIFMMPYNPPFYANLIEQAGYEKAKDLLGYYFDIKANPLDRFERLTAGVMRREKGLVVNRISRKNLDAGLAKVKEVYNAAWEDNWGFVPMTDADIDFMAGRLKPLMVEELSLLVEINGEPVAFMMSIPDYNQVFKPLNGRLLTPRILGALPYLLGWKQTRLVRQILLGIKKGFRQRGLDAVMFGQSLKASLKLGFEGCDLSWILEDNIMVQRPIRVFGGRQYKKWRIFGRPV